MTDYAAAYLTFKFHLWLGIKRQMRMKNVEFGSLPSLLFAAASASFEPENAHMPNTLNYCCAAFCILFRTLKINTCYVKANAF